MQGIYVGSSPLHASTVGLILSPKTNRISPQFHFIYDDLFEIVPHSAEDPPPKWDDLVIENFESIDLEFDPNGDQFDNGLDTQDSSSQREHQPEGATPVP